MNVLVCFGYVSDITQSFTVESTGKNNKGNRPNKNVILFKLQMMCDRKAIENTVKMKPKYTKGFKIPFCFIVFFSLPVMTKIEKHEAVHSQKATTKSTILAN